MSPPRPNLKTVRQHVVHPSHCERNTVAAAVKSGMLVRVARRSYLESDHVRSFDSRFDGALAIALGRILGVAHQRGSTCIVTGASAAWVHGCNYLVDSEPITLCSQPDNRKRPVELPAVIIPGHTAVRPMTVPCVRRRVPHELVTTVEGVPVLTPEATVAWCATSLSPEQAIVIGNRLMHVHTRFDLRHREESRFREATFKGRVVSLLSTGVTWHGRAAACDVVERMDAACGESVGESILLCILQDAGLVGFETQFAITCDGRLYYADFAFPGLKLVIEFDGRAKMTIPLAPEEDLADTLLRRLDMHDARQNDIQGQGWQVVRVKWADLMHPDAIVARIHRAVANRPFAPR